MSAFDDAIASRRIGDSTIAWSVRDGWQQGRGAWGGLVVGALVAAVVGAEPDPRRTVRSVTAQIMAPVVVGTHVMAIHCLRSGSAMSTWRACVRDEAGGDVATATVILGTARVADTRLEHATWGVATPPLAPPPDQVPTLEMPPPLAPVFVQHIRSQPVRGLPLSGEPAESVGWIAYAESTDVTAASLIALVDAWWPASYPVLPDVNRFATVAFAANLLVDPASVSADEPLLHHSFLTAAHEGFTSEHRRLWTADGRLAVDNLQSIVVGA